MSDVIAKDNALSDLHIGDVVTNEKTISESDLDAFAALSGDRNPLHMDASYAESTPFKKRVVFGMLLGAYVSELVGMQLPGRRALILKESLEFKKPVYLGDTITVRGEIVSKSDSTGLIEIAIAITRLNELVTTGTVNARVRPQ